MESDYLHVFIRVDDSMMTNQSRDIVYDLLCRMKAAQGSHYHDNKIFMIGYLPLNLIPDIAEHAQVDVLD